MDCTYIFRRWRRWIGFVVIIIYTVLLVIALPLCIWEFERKGAPDHVEAWFIGGVFVMMALPISFWGILQHVINYTTPHLQRHIIRILWMVPIYALNAWFALRFPGAAIYLDTLRECYEAYVIYNFMAYLMSFLHHEYPNLEIQIENKPPVKHVFPLCRLPPCHYSMKFIQRCKHGVLQYTVVRPVMTIVAVMCEMFNKYDEGDFNFTTGWSYIVIVNNTSQIMAMYCLVLFYKAFKEELQPLKPVPKFLCVKTVVFLSFWQAVIIAALATFGVIPQNGSWVFYKSIKEVSTGIQDFLICIEMFLAALAHYYSFSHKPFINLAAEQQNCLTSFFSMWDVRDVREDVVEHARYIGRGMQNRLRPSRNTDPEGTPLLLDAKSNRTQMQSMLQYSQRQSPPTPAVIVDGDTYSCGEDSLSDRQFHSSVNRSTTSSMNNFIDMGSSTEVGPEAYQRLTSLAEHNAEKVDQTMSASRTLGTTASARGGRIDSDDIFEPLEKVEDDDNTENIYSESKSVTDGAQYPYNKSGMDGLDKEHEDNLELASNSPYEDQSRSVEGTSQSGNCKSNPDKHEDPIV